MKKNPPKFDLSQITTAHTAYGENKMFAIREGLSAEETLLFACHMLQGAEAAVSLAADQLEPYERSRLCSATQVMESEGDDGLRA